MNYEKLTKLSIRNHSELSERWVQDRIADDPALLGLGDLILKDKERNQSGAGRLDLLLQEADSTQRYEVEIQLGKTDESHIIRTIEYWDIERKRYPQYEHTAVLVAEEITSRFLNVISLFNGTIPLVAIQMSAVRLGDTVSLVFTTVLDQVRLGLVDEDEETQEVTDRAYWETRGSKGTVAMADELLEMVRTLDPALELKYNKFYIGLAKDGQPDNFVQFRPQKNAIRLEARLSRTEEIESILESAGLDMLDYDGKWRRYRIRLQAGDIKKHADVLQQLIERAHGEAHGGTGY
jgi:predicted transport protein